MNILNIIPKKIIFFLIGIVVLGFLSSCGIYSPSDARVVSPNSKERVKKNLEEGKGLSMKRFRPRAKGRASSIVKPFSKLTKIGRAHV